MPKLQILKGFELSKHPILQETMFKDRAKQFVDRLHWPNLYVNKFGWETDEYDRDATLYVIWELDDKTHGGSMRLLPMNGKNMLFDHFQELVPNGLEMGPRALECTRLVVPSNSHKSASRALLLAATEMLEQRVVSEIFGVFDRKMYRTYSRWGFAPKLYKKTDDISSWIALGGWSNCTLEHSRWRHETRSVFHSGNEFPPNGWAIWKPQISSAVSAASVEYSEFSEPNMTPIAA